MFSRRQIIYFNNGNSREKAKAHEEHEQHELRLSTATKQTKEEDGGKQINEASCLVDDKRKQKLNLPNVKKVNIQNLHDILHKRRPPAECGKNRCDSLLRFRRRDQCHHIGLLFHWKRQRSTHGTRRKHRARGHFELLVLQVL